ncbi:MAG TPA: hypothetical protein VEH07_06900 [Alphaproteobacteria bacterium]|nr:hypothetical protein [Alphaproteobacteria bacterium]
MRWAAFAWFLVALAALSCNARAEEPALLLETRIDIGPVHGRLDHLAIDLARKRLFVAEYSNDSVGVIDLNLRKLARTIGGMNEPQGVAYVAAADVLYVANGGDGTVRVLHGADLSPAGIIKLDSDADNIRVDEAAGLVFVAHGEGGIATIDARAQELVSDIKLRAHPEGFALDPDGRTIYANVPGAHEIAVLDRAKSLQVASWPIKERGNYPMALEPSTPPRIVVATRAPARLLTTGTSQLAGQTLDDRALCGDADDVFVDVPHARKYISCGDGFVQIVSASAPSLSVQTSIGARTSLFVPELDRLYVAVPRGYIGHAAIWVFRMTSNAAAP